MEAFLELHRMTSHDIKTPRCHLAYIRILLFSGGINKCNTTRNTPLFFLFNNRQQQHLFGEFLEYAEICWFPSCAGENQECFWAAQEGQIRALKGHFYTYFMLLGMLPTIRKWLLVFIRWNKEVLMAASSEWLTGLTSPTCWCKFWAFDKDVLWTSQIWNSTWISQ